jgi:MFS-type transporter involved in bile tolerance (Atg22 family)
MFIGTLCIVWAKQILFWPAVIMVGFGWGGLYTLLQLLSANIFGNKALGKILGTVTILDAFGGGMGIWLTGVLYDSTGSYATSFNIIAALVGLSFILSFFVNEKKGYQYA